MIRIKQIFYILLEISKLPKVKIKFYNYTDKTKSKYLEIYKYFTKLHRLKLFKNKTIGVALIDLGLFKTFEDYYKSINGKNSSAYYARKALKRNYFFSEIDRNKYAKDIYNINMSAETRQGRRMTGHYLIKQDTYINEPAYRYFGILNDNDELLAYCYIGFFGEFVLVNTLLGHKKYLNDGIMYLMMVELNKLIFNDYKNKGYKFIMYDTFFGASDGLKKFKQKLGYKSYKVKWLWGN